MNDQNKMILLMAAGMFILTGGFGSVLLSTVDCKKLDHNDFGNWTKNNPGKTFSDMKEICNSKSNDLATFAEVSILVGGFIFLYLILEPLFRDEKKDEKK